MACKHCDAVLNGEPHKLREGYGAYSEGNYAEAFRRLLPFAKEGEAMAQCLVASMYQLGLGINVDVLAAESWYLKAGEQGCPLSYNNLASMYAMGYVELKGKNEKASEYFDRAVELGFDVVADNPYKR